MKRASLCALLTAILAGCSLWPRNIVNPTYSIREVRPHVNLGIPPSIDLQFTVGVNNPNRAELRLNHLDFDLLIDNDLVLTNVHSIQGIHIPGPGYGEVHLTTHLTYANIESIFRHVAEVVQGDRANYTLRGNAYFDTWLGTRRFPITVNFR